MVPFFCKGPRQQRSYIGWVNNFGDILVGGIDQRRGPPRWGALRARCWQVSAVLVNFEANPFLAPLPHTNSLCTALIALSSLATLLTLAALTSLTSLTIPAALAALSLAALSTATQSGCVAASFEMLVHLLLPCEALRTHLRNRQCRGGMRVSSRPSRTLTADEGTWPAMRAASEL